MHTENVSDDRATPDERAGMDWWNSMSEQSRKTMLESPAVRDNPTPAMCWQAFKSKGESDEH